MWVCTSNCSASLRAGLALLILNELYLQKDFVEISWLSHSFSIGNSVLEWNRTGCRENQGKIV